MNINTGDKYKYDNEPSKWSEQKMIMQFFVCLYLAVQLFWLLAIKCKHPLE